MDKPRIEVIAHFTLDGIIIPWRIRMFTDTEEIVVNVDNPSNPARCHFLKIGVQGDRYTCKIGGEMAYLYRDHDNKWFVELI